MMIVCWCVVLLVLASVLPSPVWGEQCKPDSINPCIARCNGTTFDISHLVDYPFNISGFIWSPCDGFNCTSDVGLDCAVCQNIVESYNVSCGMKSNAVWIWDVNESGTKTHYGTPPFDFPNWRIEFTFGTYWRFSIFEFVIDETQKETVVEYMGEEPALQYNFRVRGRCIGQPTLDCKKQHDKDRLHKYKL